MITDRKKQGGYLLVTVVVTLFLVATIAMLLNHDSAISANTSSAELEAVRADYIVETGMQHALWRSANNACADNFTIPTTSFGIDSYSATVTGCSISVLDGCVARVTGRLSVRVLPLASVPVAWIFTGEAGPVPTTTSR